MNSKFTRDGKCCPKCGHDFGYDRYIARKDIIEITCASCKYTRKMIPLDRKDNNFWTLLRGSHA